MPVSQESFGQKSKVPVSQEQFGQREVQLVPVSQEHFDQREVQYPSVRSILAKKRYSTVLYPIVYGTVYDLS